MADDAVCPRDGTFFDDVAEGWHCEGCGETICPLCINPITELCLLCEWEGLRQEEGDGE